MCKIDHWIIWQVGEAEVNWPDSMVDQVKLMSLPLPSLSELTSAQRPAICLCTDPALLTALAGQPCPVWGLGFEGYDGCLAGNFQEFLIAAGQPYNPGNWLSHIYFCLPLAYLWNSSYYKHLVQSYKLNLELGLDWQALDQIIPNNFTAIKKFLATISLTAHMPFMDLHPGAADPWVADITLQRLQQAAQVAIELRAKRAVFHLGYDARLNRELDAFIQLVCQRLDPICRLLQQAGCLPVLENVFEPTPHIILMVRERLENMTGGQVGLCLDVGHAQAFNHTDLQKWWQAFSPYLAEIHLHDNPGDDDLHWAVGSGIIDFTFVGQALKKQPTAPLLTLEIRSEEALWQSLRTINQLWGPATCGMI